MRYKTAIEIYNLYAFGPGMRNLNINFTLLTNSAIFLNTKLFKGNAWGFGGNGGAILGQNYKTTKEHKIYEVSQPGWNRFYVVSRPGQNRF